VERFQGFNLMNTLFTRRSFLLVALAAGAFGTSTLIPTPAVAHEADCPYCSLPVIQDTDTQDNEVKLRYGRKRIEYRCVFCALSEAQSEYKEGDLTIAAPSEKKGEYIVIKREKGTWSAPANTIFAAKKMNHRVCQITYRAFASKAGFEAWVKAHPDQFDKDTQPLTLTQMLEVSKPPAKTAAQG
jgi:hypothetical protein